MIEKQYVRERKKRKENKKTEGDHTSLYNPKPEPRTLRPPPSTAAHARRRPAVDRPAHQPSELVEINGEGGAQRVCYFLHVIYYFFPFSFSDFLPSLSTLMFPNRGTRFSHLGLNREASLAM
jgi:hypothetical protein